MEIEMMKDHSLVCLGMMAVGLVVGLAGVLFRLPDLSAVGFLAIVTAGVVSTLPKAIAEEVARRKSES